MIGSGGVFPVFAGLVFFMKLKSLILTAIVLNFGVLALPSETFANCKVEIVRAKKECSKKKKKSSLCKRRTREVNSCLKRLAKKTTSNQVCVALYLPVCALNLDGSFETYSNSCQAAVNKAVVVDSGLCLKNK